jgi:hypothetical protein
MFPQFSRLWRLYRLGQFEQRSANLGGVSAEGKLDTSSASERVDQQRIVRPVHVFEKEGRPLPFDHSIVYLRDLEVRIN